MLECRACVLRCIRAIADDGASSLNGTLVLTPRMTVNPARRRLTTASTAAPRDALSSYPPSGRTNPKEEPTRLVSNSTERALQSELKYLNDPLKLASHIHYVLRQNDPAKALDLARLASKSARSTSDVVVAWNHCVDWHMRSGRVTEALKIYNEMKKRGVFPDAHTYTILFRSFLPKAGNGNGVDEGTVAKATSIYYSMLTPTSRVKPGIIHTNAVLRVCSLAGDMDALWGVAARIPEHGPGSADTVTYTILLSAIRYGAMGTADEGGVYLDQIGGKRQSAVNEGRRIWMECIQKWRSGDLVIDSELVCQMGNLLLISNRMEDWDDVLSLVAQTTRIPRQIVPLDHPDRRIGHVPQETPIGEDVVQSTGEEDQDGFLPTPASKAFNAIPTTNTSNPIWVHPGNPILSVLIQACLTMRIPKAANAYWEIITSPPYSLIPDLANYQAMLRLYRLNRSSAKAAALVEHMHSPEGGSTTPRNHTYRDALAVCARDHKNPSIMAIATRIVEDMGKRAQHPDAPTLQAFLSLAMTTDSGYQISAAFDTLDAFLPQILSQIPGEEAGEKGRVRERLGKEGHRAASERLKHGLRPNEEEALAFAKQMAASIQKVMSVGMIPKEQLKPYLNRRNRLNRNIGRAEQRNVRNWYFEGGDGVARNKTTRERERENNTEKSVIRFGGRVGKKKRSEKKTVNSASVADSAGEMAEMAGQ